MEYSSNESRWMFAVQLFQLRTCFEIECMLWALETCSDARLPAALDQLWKQNLWRLRDNLIVIGWSVYAASLLGILVLHLMGLDTVFVFDRITFFNEAKGDLNITLDCKLCCYFLCDYSHQSEPDLGNALKCLTWLDQSLKQVELCIRVIENLLCYVLFGKKNSECWSASAHLRTE
jgi:hypothetical protein